VTCPVAGLTVLICFLGYDWLNNYLGCDLPCGWINRKKLLS
jgi:hypothetical protein